VGRLLDAARAGAAVGASALVLLAGAAAQAADPLRGRSVFEAQCSTCHSNGRGGGVVVGPPLYGVVGRKAGSVPGFAYSATMRNAGFVWSEAQLRAYLPSPRRYLPDVKMTYPGLKNPNQLDDLIAYLDTLK
jgi:cytochrome c